MTGRQDPIAARDAALAREAALSRVLGLINRSPDNPNAVYDAILEEALGLIGSGFGGLGKFEGDAFHTISNRGMPPAWAEYFSRPYRPSPGGRTERLLRGEPFVQMDDLQDISAYKDSAGIRAMRELGGGIRTVLWVAMRRGDACLGFLTFFRMEVRPFDMSEIALLRAFADQAAIAMENARLLTEQREALEQQTATAEILGVINSSPGNLAPVFQVILEKAHTLCGASLGQLMTFDGTLVHGAAWRGLPDQFASLARQPFYPGPAMLSLIRGDRIVHVPDIRTIGDGPETPPIWRAWYSIIGAGTYLIVPLRKENHVVGFINAFRPKIRPFSDKEIALLENFAAQAVIAMENARLITETREALEQQTATAEVLGVINASPGNLEPVYDALLEKALRLTGSVSGSIFTYDGRDMRRVVERGAPAAWMERTAQNPVMPFGSHHPASAVLTTRRPVVIPDLTETEAYKSGHEGFRARVQLGAARASLNVPLVRDDAVVGLISVYRTKPGTFADKQIALLENFAAQAVIAMENARLITETREALEQQQASAEILSVISTSVDDARPVFDKILESCKQIVGGDELNVVVVDEKGMLQLAAYMGSLYDTMRATFPAPVAITPAGRAIRDGKIVHYPDIVNDPDTPRVLRRIGQLAGYTAGVFAPMIWKGQGIGAIGVARARGAFSERELALMQSFADQAVIAIQNAQMFKDTRDARIAAETALEDLRRTQDRLVQTEKMASLGQLTAGIAHEIKNPLNFVNNFSDLSTELLDELNAAIAPLEAVADPKLRDEIDDLTATLKGNLAKIAEHGRRADSIVKNMLEHSRSGTSERRAVNFNNLAEEALNLAYHGARAEFPGFNITMEKDLDPAAGEVDLYPQEFTRVLLNLISNGFYATRKRAEQAGAGYEPTLRLSTRANGAEVEITVRDNGTGMPASVREKIFEPFFTTKPAGEGTGLGLSLSFDIVVKQHGGQISVDSEPGSFTEFRVVIPRQAFAGEKRP